MNCRFKETDHFYIESAMSIVRPLLELDLKFLQSGDNLSVADLSWFWDELPGKYFECLR